MMDLDFIDNEAREKYKDRRKLDLIHCRESLKSRNYDVIQTIGHNLKGNGISFGFPELSTLGEEMENSAKESNSFELEDLINRFEQWVTAQERLKSTPPEQ
jgi:HPt (histidine-containing phosphotransfer) domain-containing protein